MAPTFTLQPKDNQRLIALAPTHSSTVTWKVMPTTVGLATLAFTAGNASEQIGLNVVSGNGFSPYQSQTFDYLAIFFGFLLSLGSVAAWLWWPNRRSTPRSPETTVGTPATPEPAHSSQRQETTMAAVKSAPDITANPTRSAPQSPRAPKSKAVGRRALLAGTATADIVGVVGVTALAVPQLRNSLEQDATALGRKALAHELASLDACGIAHRH